MSFLVSDRTGGNYELSLADGGALPVFTATGNAAGGNGILVFPNIAAMSAFDAAGLPAGGQTAYVQSVGAYWVLQPGEGNIDGITEATATDSSGHVRYWERWASGIQYDTQPVLDWYIDPVAGNDENVGTNIAAPLKSKAELARRWGTWSPTIRNALTTIHYLASDTSGQDPGTFAPICVNGGILRHTAPLPAPSFTGTLNAVTPKNHAANQALTSTFTATTGAVAANMLLVNTTRGNSRAWAVRDTGGGNWLLSQPLTPYVGSGAPFPSEVDTWANGDAIEGYNLVAVDLVLLDGDGAEHVPANAPTHIVWQLRVYDPQGPTSGNQVKVRRQAVSFAECQLERGLNVDSVTNSLWLANNFYQNRSDVRGWEVGVNTGGVFLDVLDLEGLAFESDTIFSSANTAVLRNSYLFGGYSYIDQGTTITARGTATTINPSSGIYGPGTWDQVDGTLTYFDAAATSFYAAFTVVGMSTAYSFATAGGVTSVHQLALSAANLDAAAGAAGFGGYATGGGVTLCRNGTQP